MMGNSILWSIGWLGLANAAMSAVLVGVAYVVSRRTRSTTLASVLWTLALLKLISPGFNGVPISVPDAWRTTAEHAPAAKTPASQKPAVPGSAAKPRTKGLATAPAIDKAPASPAATSQNVLIEPRTIAVAVLGTWIIGVLAFAAVAMQRLITMRRAVRRADVAPQWILDEVAERCSAAGVRSIPDVRLVDIPISPLVGSLGWTPVLLLPRSFYCALSKDDRELLLAHEIAHLRRWDHLRAWLELLAVTVFWWNPLAWYARHRSRMAAEDCCDNWVVHWFPDRAAEYGEVLLKCVDFSSARPRRLPAPMYGISRFSITRRRLLRILESPRAPQMSRIGTLAISAMALLALTSIPVVGDQSHHTAAPQLPPLPARSPAAPITKTLFFDLDPIANVGLAEDFGRQSNNNLKTLPRGRQEFGGVEYLIGNRFILLQSQMAIARRRPQAVRGIRIGQKIDSLNLLHGAAWNPEESGEEIGSLIVRYEGGSTEKIPIVYGEDVRDWWDMDNNAPVTRGRIVWRGDNDASKRLATLVDRLRLYDLSWTNPHPDRVIETIDFVSTSSSECSPFLVAMTAKQQQATE